MNKQSQNLTLIYGAEPNIHERARMDVGKKLTPTTRS